MISGLRPRLQASKSEPPRILATAAGAMVVRGHRLLGAIPRSRSWYLTCGSVCPGLYGADGRQSTSGVDAVLIDHY